MKRQTVKAMILLASQKQSTDEGPVDDSDVRVDEDKYGSSQRY